MATEVELFEFNDIPSRPSIRGYVDVNGDAKISAGGVDMPTFATDPLTGAVTGLVGPGGAVVKIADTSYTLPPTVLRITAAQIVVGKTCKLTSVKCIVGTAITLTVYDNQTLATGSALFSQAMSAGDEAVIPNGVQAINGIYGSFTGTATFDIGVQDAV